MPIEIRESAAGIKVETQREETLRMSAAGIKVETQIVDEKRMSAAGIMVEWVPPEYVAWII